jgi:hypothetical protein
VVFGNANRAYNEPTQPYHMFRIASSSKPITSIAIMKLIENGQLSLSDKPFGPGGILNSDPYFAKRSPSPTRGFITSRFNICSNTPQVGTAI